MAVWTVCPECGVVVADSEKHTAWHEPAEEETP